jgi:phage gpG-like protein
MSTASFQSDLAGLKKLITQFENPIFKKALLELPNRKEVHALISQAIAENFDKEGPGWAPLKAQTILRSVSRKMRRDIKQGKRSMEGARKILQRTGLLKKSVTTPGAQGHIHRMEGSNLVWGTDLMYAAIHQHGGTVQRGDHTINIPARPYLKLSDFWKLEIETFALNQALLLIQRSILRAA